MAKSESGTAEALKDALERILARAPVNPVLAEQNKCGKLRVSFFTVAMEAGVSRTLIGYEDCQYPDIRQLVKDAILASASPGRGSMRDRLKSQALEISELKDELALRDLIRASAVVEASLFNRGKKKDGKPLNPKSPLDRRAELSVVRSDDSSLGDSE